MELRRRYLSYFIIFTLMIINITACGNDTSQQQHQEKTKTITVKRQDYNAPLFFNGIIKPINIDNVSSPVQGVVTKMSFAYGEFVTKDQKLLTIKSEALEKKYQTALTGYIKKKESFYNLQQKFEATLGLKKEGIVSDNEYRTALSSYNDAYLGYIQARYKLRSLLEKLQINPRNIFKLTIENRSEMGKILRKSTNEITIKAPGTGIALRPITIGSSSDSDKSSNVMLGQAVKRRATLLSIGDTSGLTIKVKIDEINILSIIKGQKVTVTGVGFPGITLHGYVSEVSNQASQSQSGGLPTFPITIIIPKITPREQQVINIGMSAQVKMLIDKGQAIIIPLKAVTQKNQMNFVTIVNPKTGNKKQVMVQTGSTTENGVVITNGLKAGEKILVRY